MAKKKSDSAGEGAAAGSKAAKSDAAKKPAAGTNKPTAAAAAPAKKSTAAAPAAKKPATGAPATSPMIDTNLAANAAAAMIAAKGAGGGAQQQGPKKESGAFKQLKAGLNKPANSSLGGAFSVPQQSKKSPTPFGGAKQVGHNQTFGADVNRTGVPRRTPG